MEIKKNSDWFQKNIMSQLIAFEVIEKQFPDGDFGNLDQLEFNSEKIQGNVDFWSKGWIGILVWDDVSKKELLNVLWEPHETEQIIESFNKLKDILQLKL